MRLYNYVRILVNLVGLLCFIVLFISCRKSDELKLFNGESLEGWEGSNTIFRVEKGAIVGAILKNQSIKVTICVRNRNMKILN